jgi:glutamyl-tRNA synthetase
LKDNSEIIDYISNVFDTSKYSYTKLDAIAHICKQRAVFMTDILPVAKIFFTDMSVKVDDAMFKNTFTHFLKRVHSIKVWKAALIKDEILAICDEMGIKIGKLMPGLRNSLTGGVSGPDLMTTMEIIGREETYKRIKESI